MKSDENPKHMYYGLLTRLTQKVIRHHMFLSNKISMKTTRLFLLYFSNFEIITRPLLYRIVEYFIYEQIT